MNSFFLYICLFLTWLSRCYPSPQRTPPIPSPPGAQVTSSGSEGWLQLQGSDYLLGCVLQRTPRGATTFFLFFFCSPLLTLLPLVRHEVAPLTADPLLCCQPVCSSLHVHISPPRTQPLPKLYRSYSHCHHKVTQAAEPLPLPHPDFFFLGLSQKGRERCLLGFIRPLRLRH